MSKVSVIIPVVNGNTTLRDAVDSVFSQDARDFEVIVADDGSTDSARTESAPRPTPRKNQARASVSGAAHAAVPADASS
jgi:GT2 family glycosyltransferase